MKKTNFVVIFWLMLALISFVAGLMQLGSIFNAVSYIIIPGDQEYMSQSDFLRTLISSVPMVLLEAGVFFYSAKTGMKAYNESIPKEIVLPDE